MPDLQPVTSAACHETFPSVEAATEHYYAAHGKPEDEPPPVATAPGASERAASGWELLIS